MNHDFVSHYYPLFLVASVILTWPFTILFHELGHAIPSLLFCKGKVRICLGSMGNFKKGFKLNFGRLEIYIRPLYVFKGGICFSDTSKISINKKIIRVAGGPFATLLCIFISFLFFYLFPFNKITSLFFLGFAITSLAVFLNVISISNKRIRVENGNYIYNDLTTIRNLFSEKKYPEKYKVAATFYNDKKFREAGLHFKQLIDHNLKNENIYSLAITSFMETKEYETALEIAEDFEKHYPKESAFRAYSAHIYGRLNNYEKALEGFQKSLLIEPENLNLHVNRGYCLLKLKRYQESITEFEKVIATEKTNSYAYTNMGLAKYMSGKKEEGIENLEHAIHLHDKDSYANLNLGIIKLIQNKKEEALDFFLKAKECNPETHLVDNYISQAKQ
jgi:tetratricopeptide (TPR) repeat protein